MRTITTVFLSTVLFFAIITVFAPTTASAESPAIATITLYHDSDNNDVFGSAGDRMIASTTIGQGGSFILNAIPCANCGAVVDGWGWDDPDIDSVGGTIVGDGMAPTSGVATLWLDSDNNGIFGSAGDTVIASTALDSSGAYEQIDVSFESAGMVIDGWGWDDPDIDSIGGTLDAWIGNGPEAGGNEIDWGFGDDEIDWGFGDDEIDWGFGDDEIDWGFGDDEIDWGFGDDEIDWGFGDDEIDWGFGDDEID